MNRRSFLERALVMGTGAAVAQAGKSAAQNDAPRVAFTFDDFAVFDTPTLLGSARNQGMLDALRAHDVQAAVFPIGRNVENADAMRLLESWDTAGHIVGNHTYSHRRYSRASFTDFTEDVLRCEQVLSHLPQFRKWLRFPVLDEGNTAEQRDRMRAFMVEEGYRNGHVTIDASDWYIDGRLRRRLEQQPDATRCRTASSTSITSGSGPSSTTACRGR